MMRRLWGGGVAAVGDDPRDIQRLARAKEIFLAARGRGLVERADLLARECGDDDTLRVLVDELLRGEDMPLPFESLADDIRAAHDKRPTARTAVASGVGVIGNDRIGNYRLLERIGEGGFGIVFMAEQERPVRRRVALKIIKLGMDTKQVVARFEAERQALALMDHPGIARVFDAGATETGRPYFVMELVRGLPITDYCDQRKLSIRDRLALVSQVCEALQHAHQRGVIHRDIKPTNVLVADVGGKPMPKIIDFGIAKATSARLTEKTIFTEFRQMIGTPEYMSPEQAGESAEDVDTRTDVYAAGVLLYELLTGATPFDSKRLRSAAFGEMQRIIREEDPPKPSTRVLTKPETLDTIAQARSTQSTKLTSTIEGELDWIVMKAIEKDRSRRYDSAGSMAADIQRYLTGHAVLAAPPGRAYLIRKFVRRHRGPVAAGSLLALALVAGLVGTSLGFFNAERQRKVAVKEKDRADENATQARTAESLATHSAYSANLMSASTAVSGVQYSTARTFLDNAPAALRGWEWRVLNAKLDTSIRTVSIAAKPTGGMVSDELMLHPDGRSFFTIDRLGDPPVQRWDVETGRLLQSVPPPFQRVSPESSRAFISPDGRRLTVAPEFRLDGSKGIAVDSWDLSTGQRAAHSDIACPTSSSVRVIPSEDGTRVVIYSDRRVWSVRTTTEVGGEVLAEHPLNEQAFPLAFNHGDTMIAEGVRSAPYGLVLRNAHSLAPVAVLAWRALVQNVCFSADDRWLGVAANDDTARVWDLSASPPTFIALQHQFQANNIRFSPDASLVATIAMDRAIRIWDRATGRLLGTYPSESLDPYPLMFMPDGKTVAGWETDGTIRFWDVTAERTSLLRGHKSIVSKAKFAGGNPAGVIVSSSWEGADGSTGTVRLWDADSGDEVGVHQGRLGDIAYAMAVSDDGRFAAIGILNKFEIDKALGGLKDVPIGRTEVLDLTTGELVFAAPLLRNPQWIAFAGDNRSVVVADTPADFNSAHQLHLLDARTGAVIRTRELDSKPSWVFARSPDGRTIAALPLSRGSATAKADRPGTMLFLDTQTLETVRAIDGIPERQMSIALSPDGSRIATGGEDGLLRIFKADTGEQLATMSGQGMEILTIAFSPDGSRIASAGMDRKVRLWDAKTFEQVAAFAGHEGHIGDLDWDAKGERLLSCSGDTTVRIWEPAPIRTRVQARAARAAALVQMEPMAAKLFDELADAAKVIDRINADTKLSPLNRKTARQLVLKHGLEQDRHPQTDSGSGQSHR